MSKHVRTTSELIAVLDAEAEAGNFDAVCLAVGFEESATVIFANDPNRLITLNRAVEQGGEPVGLISIQKEGRIVRVFSRLFSEYKGEQWAREFLEDLADSCGRALCGRNHRFTN